jgi:hypothetical protein
MWRSPPRVNVLGTSAHRTEQARWRQSFACVCHRQKRDYRTRRRRLQRGPQICVEGARSRLQRVAEAPSGQADVSRGWGSFRDRQTSGTHQATVAMRCAPGLVSSRYRRRIEERILDRIEAEFFTQIHWKCFQPAPFQLKRGSPRCLRNARDVRARARRSTCGSRAAESLDLYVGNVHSGLSWVSLLAHRMAHCYIYHGLLDSSDASLSEPLADLVPCRS